MIELITPFMWTVVLFGEWQWLERRIIPFQSDLLLVVVGISQME
jgi:glucose uptake protein GlcU